MGFHLITGYAGREHITSADHASFNAGLIGGNYVLNRGAKFQATMMQSNVVRLADGDLVMQGRHMRLSLNDVVDLQIENGAQGYKRNDLIVARYMKDRTTNIESCTLALITGVQTTGIPSDPNYATADIIDGGNIICEMPLYRLSIVNFSIDGITPLFNVLPAITSFPTVQYGTETLITTQVNTTVYTEVTFPVPFKTTPVVVVTPISSVPGTHILGTSVKDVTSTGFTLYLRRTNAESTPVSWIAIG